MVDFFSHDLSETRDGLQRRKTNKRTHGIPYDQHLTEDSQNAIRHSKNSGVELNYDANCTVFY